MIIWDHINWISFIDDFKSEIKINFNSDYKNDIQKINILNTDYNRYFYVTYEYLLNDKIILSKQNLYINFDLIRLNLKKDKFILSSFKEEFITMILRELILKLYHKIENEK